MKTKDNIHMVINLNKYISDLKSEFEIVTYAESSMMYNFVEWLKMNTLLCDDDDIHMFIMNNKYCLFFNGTRYEYNTLIELDKQLYRILNILYYLDIERGNR